MIEVYAMQAKTSPLGLPPFLWVKKLAQRAVECPFPLSHFPTNDLNRDGAFTVTSSVFLHVQ